MTFNKIYRWLDDFITNDLRPLTTSKPFSYFQLELQHDRFCRIVRILLLPLEFERCDASSRTKLFYFSLLTGDLKINIEIIEFFNIEIRRTSRPSTMKFHPGFESQCLLIDVSWIRTETFACDFLSIFKDRNHLLRIPRPGSDISGNTSTDVRHFQLSFQFHLLFN